MPYIKPEDREPLDGLIDELANKLGNCGDLNYAMTRIAHRYIQEYGHRYKTMNEVIGAIECMKLELYRTVAGPYEDSKIDENGYVSETDTRHHVTLYRNDVGASKKTLMENNTHAEKVNSDENETYP